MHIVLLTHPVFLPSESMVRFAAMLKRHYESRGHSVAHWRPEPVIHALVPGGPVAKWAGYLDLFLLFPFQMRRALRREPEDTLFVFCDQALGPWVPLVRGRPHVVHCHDLLTLRAALGDIPARSISVTGRLYQRYIRRGFRRAEQFICISNKTRDDLVRFGGIDPARTDVVYNGLNHPYRRIAPAQARRELQRAGLPVDAGPGPLLHVGSGAWYKNKAGLIRLYARYAEQHTEPLPLWIVGHPSSGDGIEQAMATVPAQGRIVHLPGLDNDVLQAAYSHASAMLFPSLAEGFGWPLVEAQCCGCPVLTTDAAPMNEVAGPVAGYLPVMPADGMDAWARHGAAVLQRMLDVDDAARARRAEQAIAWAQRFNADDAVSAYLAVYARVLARRGYAAAADGARGAPPLEIHP